MTRALKEALKTEVRRQIRAQRRTREAAVEVMNLATQEKQVYTLPPEQAVIAAYAQAKGDYNTWDYGKYRNLVKKGKLTVTCGDWSAFQDGRPLTK